MIAFIININNIDSIKTIKKVIDNEYEENHLNLIINTILADHMYYKYNDLLSYDDYIKRIKNNSLITNNAFEIYYLYNDKWLDYSIHRNEVYSIYSYRRKLSLMNT